MKTILSEKTSTKLIYLAAFILLGSYAVGISSQKNIFLDGSRILYNLIQFETFHRDYPQTRFSSTLIQTPLVVFQNIFGNAAAVNYGTYFLGYSHLAVIAFSLLFTLALAFKHRQVAVGFIAALSAGLCVAPSITFLGSYAVDAFSYSWILFSCYFFLSGKKRLGGVLLCILLLSFSYETAAIILLLTALISLTWFRKNRYENVIIAGCFIGILYQVHMVTFIVADETRDSFFRAMLFALDSPFLIWTLCAILAVSIHFIFNIPEKIKIAVLGILVTFGVYLVINMRGETALLHSFHSRTFLVFSVIPLFIAVGLILIKKRSVLLKRVDILFLFSVAGICSAYEVKQAVSWMNAYSELLSIKNDSAKCHVLSLDETLRLDRLGLHYNHLIWYQVLLGHEQEVTNLIFPSPLTVDSRSADFKPCEQMTPIRVHIPNPNFYIHFADPKTNPPYILKMINEKQ